MKIDPNIPNEILNFNLSVYQNIYSATLSLNNIIKKNNKFFIMQLLENKISDTTKNYLLFYRYGRIGYVGEIDIDFYINLDDALKVFLQTFLDKTGYTWESRNDITDVIFKDKYIYTDIEEDKPPIKEQNIDESNQIIDKYITFLLKIIYDENNYLEITNNLGLDSKKNPLGSLTNKQIQKAFKIINKISGIIKDDKGNLIEDLDDTQLEEINNLTSVFYSIIPTYLKTGKIPPIKTLEQLDQKIDLLNTLIDANILYNNLNNSNPANDKINNMYLKLNAQIKFIDYSNEYYKIINQYLNSNAGTTHNFKLKLSYLYEFNSQRSHESKYKTTDESYLLWHGSRTINIVSILTNGLLINPLNVIINGKMFGNGIYFANCSTKSAQYSSYDSDGYGILLLCEVKLKNIYVATKSSIKPVGYDTVHGAGKWTPNPVKHIKKDGLIIPTGELIDSKYPGSSLYYDEFIVYDQNDIKIRYIAIVNYK
jgi:hypothetical protein